MTDPAIQHVIPAALEALVDVVMLVDAKRNILDVNSAFVNHCGNHRGFWIGKSLDSVAVTSGVDLGEVIGHCLKGGTVADQPLDLVSNSGEAMPVLASFSRFPLLDVQCVVVCAKDVAKFKLVEYELRETERRYRYFVEQTQEGFYRLDFDEPISTSLPPADFIQQMYVHGYIAECNDIYAEMYGYENASEMKGARLVDLHGGDDVGENLEAMHAFVRDGYQHLEIETTEYDKQGNAIHLSNNSVGIIQGDVQVSVWGTQRDITQRKQAEIALRDSEARLRAILDGAGDAVITIDNHGVIHDVNRMTERMFGYSTTDLVGQNAHILMPQPVNERKEFLPKAYVEGLGDDVVGCCKDLSTFPAEITISDIPELGLYIVNIRDVSEQKLLQRQVLSIAEDEQRRIGRDLHDSAQQELAGLGLMAQTLHSLLSHPDSTSSDAPQPTQIAEKMMAAINRTNQEIRRVSQGLVPVSLDAKDLSHALSELAVRTNDLGRVRCTFHCDGDVRVDDDWAAMHLYRIAQEATANALKHACPTSISIALSTDESEPVLTIENDGQGFDPSQVRVGIGLRTMHYRASLIGATLNINGNAGGGTQVVCKVYNRRRDIDHS